MDDSKIITASRPKTLLRVFLMGKSQCPTKGWNREGVSLQKFELSPSVGYHPHQKIKSPCPFPDHRPNIKKISNSF